MTKIETVGFRNNTNRGILVCYYCPLHWSSNALLTTLFSPFLSAIPVVMFKCREDVVWQGVCHEVLDQTWWWWGFRTFLQEEITGGHPPYGHLMVYITKKQPQKCSSNVTSKNWTLKKTYTYQGQTRRNIMSLSCASTHMSPV